MTLPHALQLDLSTPLPNGHELRLAASSYLVRGAERTISTLFTVDGDMTQQRSHVYISASVEHGVTEAGFFMPNLMGRQAWDGTGSVPTYQELNCADWQERLADKATFGSYCLRATIYKLPQVIGDNLARLPEHVRPVPDALLGFARMLCLYANVLDQQVTYVDSLTSNSDTIQPVVEVLGLDI